MSQSDSWCEECQAWGDHHTDRHQPARISEAKLEQAQRDPRHREFARAARRYWARVRPR